MFLCAMSPKNENIITVANITESLIARKVRANCSAIIFKSLKALAEKLSSFEKQRPLFLKPKTSISFV